MTEADVDEFESRLTLDPPDEDDDQDAGGDVVEAIVDGEAVETTPETILAATILAMHDAAEYCDELTPRVVHRNDDADYIVCDGCPEDETSPYENPPVLWREDDGVLK